VPPTDPLPPPLDFSVQVPLGYEFAPHEPAPQVAVICHIFYVDQAAEILSYLRNILFAADLFITTSAEGASPIAETFKRWEQGKFELRVVPNRGRDIAAKLVAGAAVHRAYPFVLHLHGKASLHTAGFRHWRGYLFETLLGSPAIVASIFELFRQAPRLGIVAPQHYEPVQKRVRWGRNYPLARTLADRMGIDLKQHFDFPSGSMFWARSAALRPLLDLDLSFDSFPEETDQKDDTLAHAVERLFFFSARKAGFRWLKIARPEFFHRTGSILAVHEPAEFHRLLNQWMTDMPPTPGLLRTLGEPPD
jgi:O-antigen biosynthesis protein